MHAVTASLGRMQVVSIYGRNKKVASVCFGQDELRHLERQVAAGGDLAAEAARAVHVLVRRGQHLRGESALSHHSKGAASATLPPVSASRHAAMGHEHDNWLARVGNPVVHFVVKPSVS